MTIMTDGEILEAIAHGEIEISNFDESRLQGCSYDCVLGQNFWEHYEAEDGNYHWRLFAALNSMRKGDFVLAHTEEYIRVGLNVQFTVHTVSTSRRTGIDVCAAAGWGDPGFCNRVTLELMSNCVVPLLPQRAILTQIAFHRLSRPVQRPYKGNYGSYASIADAARAWKPENMLPKAIKSCAP